MLKNTIMDTSKYLYSLLYRQTIEFQMAGDQFGWPLLDIKD